MSNSNANTRAIVSALRSDLRPLREVAARLVDKAVVGDKSPRRMIQATFDAGPDTARTILHERARVTKSGARKGVE